MTTEARLGLVWQQRGWARTNLMTREAGLTVVLLNTKPPSRAVFIKHLFLMQSIFFGHSYSENKTSSEKSMSRAFQWRESNVEKIIGSWWKSHDFESWYENMSFYHDTMTFSTLETLHFKALPMLFNRPGVARAVLQIPSLLIDWLIHWVILFLQTFKTSFHPNHHS